MKPSALNPSLLLLLLTSFAPVTRAELIAPIHDIPERVGELSYDDYGPRAATDGASTLIVWTHAFHPYETTHKVFGRLLGSPTAPEHSFPISDFARHPLVAADDDDYVVLYAIPGSRFNTFPYESLGVRRVTASGEPGQERRFFTAMGAYPEKLMRWGDRWIAEVSSDTGTSILFLDHDLQPLDVRIDVPAERYSVVEIGGEWWVTWEEAGESFIAVLNDDGTLGRAFRQPFPGALIGSTPSHAVAVFHDGADVLLSEFDTDTGFSSPRIIVEGARALDLENRDDGMFLLLVANDSSGATEALVLDSTGSVLERSTLFDESTMEGIQLTPPALASSLLVFSSRAGEDPIRNTQSGIYAVNLDALPMTPLDLEDAVVISTTRFDFQSPVTLVSAGEDAIAIWIETVDDHGRTGTFMRRIDARGMPSGEPIPLPDSIGTDAEVVFDGTQYLIVWQDDVLRSMTVSRALEPGPVHDISNFPGWMQRVAAEDGRRFAVWVDSIGDLRGTPLRDDGSAQVQSGFPILPSYTARRSSPLIAALPHGFHLIWRDDLSWEADDVIQSAVLSEAGNLQSLSALDTQRGPVAALAAQQHSSLAAVSGPDGGSFYAFGPSAGPFELFDPIWWGEWSPISIGKMTSAAAETDDYIVTIARGEEPWIARVGMQGAWITAVDLLGPLGGLQLPPHGGTAIIGGNTLAVGLIAGTHDSRVWTARPGAVRKRTVRR